jgi:membrane protein implicated in regulation of membrane protease activity
MSPTAWFSTGVVLLLLELLGAAFFCACLAVGAFAAGLAAVVAPAELRLQLVAFVVVAPAALWISRAALRHNDRSNETPMNRDALIGKVATVTHAIEHGSCGRVAAFGTDWLARAASVDSIPQHARVQIVDVEGTTLVVVPSITFP